MFATKRPLERPIPYNALTVKSLFISASILVMIAALSACSSSPMSRIEENRAKYESWPLEVKEAVLNGEARKGMTPEQVEVALGKPSQVISRSNKSGEDEVWVYRKGGSGSSLPVSTGVSVGTNVGGVGVGTRVRGGGGRGNRGRQTSEDEEVVFNNGVVVRSDVTHK